MIYLKVCCIYFIEYSESPEVCCGKYLSNNYSYFFETIIEDFVCIILLIFGKSF